MIDLKDYYCRSDARDKLGGAPELFGLKAVYASRESGQHVNIADSYYLKSEVDALARKPQPRKYSL